MNFMNEGRIWLDHWLTRWDRIEQIVFWYGEEDDEPSYFVIELTNQYEFRVEEGMRGYKTLMALWNEDSEASDKE